MSQIGKFKMYMHDHKQQIEFNPGKLKQLITVVEIYQRDKHHKKVDNQVSEQEISEFLVDKQGFRALDAGVQRRLAPTALQFASIDEPLVINNNWSDGEGTLHQEKPTVTAQTPLEKGLADNAFTNLAHYRSRLSDDGQSYLGYDDIDDVLAQNKYGQIPFLNTNR